MDNPPHEPARVPSTGEERGPASPPGAPRWVKVSVLVFGVLLLVFVILQLAGVGGRHGPGRHQAAVPPFTAALAQRA